MIRVGRFQLYILGILFIGFICAGKDFIHLLMGDEYSAAYYCVICYLAYSIMAYPQQIGNTALIAKNYVKQRAVVSLVAAIINVSISLILSRLWGAVGACISLFVAITIRSLLLDVLYQKKLQLNIGEYFKKCYFKLLIPFTVELAISFLLCRFIPLGGWGYFLLKVLIVTAIYCIGLIFVMNNNEKSIVYGVMKIIPDTLGKLIHSKTHH